MKQVKTLSFAGQDIYCGIDLYVHLVDYNTQTLVLPGYKGKIKYAQFA